MNLKDIILYLVEQKVTRICAYNMHLASFLKLLEAKPVIRIS